MSEIEITTSGVELIAQERERQVTKEGFTFEQDDTYRKSELALAALCYLGLNVGSSAEVEHRWAWPWAPEWFKTTDYERDLVKAGALIAAELDRVIRHKRRVGKPAPATSA